MSLPDSWQDFDVAFSTALFDDILLIPDDFGKKDNKFGSEHQVQGPQGVSGTIGAPVFGGEGTGSLYRIETKIKTQDGLVNWGNIFVGALEKIEGFGGEMGDGCVSFMKT